MKIIDIWLETKNLKSTASVKPPGASSLSKALLTCLSMMALKLGMA